ncbi:unnamed protein product [Rhizopus stolonifer]
MDILKEFAEKYEKINIHDFFQSEYAYICLHNSQIALEDECWEGLRNYWTKIIDKFVITHPKKKVTKKMFKIDWEELYNTCIIDKNKKRLRSSVVQEYTSMINSIANENSFLSDSEPSLCNIVYTSKIKSVREGMEYEPELSKQDLLYYKILDFVSKSKENGTRRALGDSYNFFETNYKMDFQKSKMIGGLVKDLFEEKHVSHDFSLKKILKEKKNEIRNTSDVDDIKKTLTKSVIKALKVYQHLFEEDIYENLNEDEYTYLLVRPLIKIVLKDIPFISIKCGEPNLRCASKRQNKKLFDDERRSPGPKIDMVFKHKVYKQEIAILEISGPNNKISNRHFLEDRNKIAKNLKHILTTITDSIPPSSAAAIKRLKVYGFHLYENTFYVYSLSTTYTDIYIFSLESKFQIPMAASTLKQNSPNFFSKLWAIKDLFLKMNDSLKEVHEKSLEYSTISSDSNSDSSFPPSPKKQCRVSK